MTSTMKGLALIGLGTFLYSRFLSGALLFYSRALCLVDFYGLLRCS